MRDFLLKYSSISFLWITAMVVVLDYVTKMWALSYLPFATPTPVLPFFNLTLVFNEGAAFGFLNDAAGWQRWFFIGVTLTACIVMLGWLWRLNKTAGLHAKCEAIALTLILGGALGNLWDRIRFGHVVDFLDFYVGRWHWPAFNVADMAITLGTVSLVLAYFFKDRYSNPSP